ncbi:hypothetical protein FOA52_008409 [Chlamydomonas sp. UWO 241]|nr:hypothetical protein FOA52_008409 [Chlamydomonas sp. UWO 241]
MAISQGCSAIVAKAIAPARGQEDGETETGVNTAPGADGAGGHRIARPGRVTGRRQPRP